MIKRLSIILLLASIAAIAHAQQPNSRSEKFHPAADHHQHLFSPAMAEFQKIQPITAQAVIALLDAAGIERAALLSTAYAYSRPGREIQDMFSKTYLEARARHHFGPFFSVLTRSLNDTAKFI